MSIMDLIMDIIGTAAFWCALACVALLLRPVIINYSVRIERPGGGDGGGRRPERPPAIPARARGDRRTRQKFGLRRW